MQGFVMPNLHSQPSSDASTKYSQPQQCYFTYTPLGLLRFPLVDAVHEESDRIDDGEVDEDDMQKIKFFHFISSNAPVSESIMNPLTIMSFGTSGWVLMVSTVFLTEVGVSLNPSNHWFKSMPHLRIVSSVSSVTPRAIISWWKWS